MRVVFLCRLVFTAFSPFLFSFVLFFCCLFVFFIVRDHPLCLRSLPYGFLLNQTVEQAGEPYWNGGVNFTLLRATVFSREKMTQCSLVMDAMIKNTCLMTMREFWALSVITKRHTRSWNSIATNIEWSLSIEWLGWSRHWRCSYTTYTCNIKILVIVP